MIALAALAVAALGALAGCGADDEGGGAHPDYARALAGSPPPLAALHSQANELIGGGVDAYEDRIEALRGYPVVVNVWASWCGPCRLEFPAFQRAAARYGKRVAFLGIDSQDNDDAARRFLRDNPVPYPSYTDPDKDLASSIDASRGLPATVFYDRRGEQIHLSYVPYVENADLVADIERYALGEPGGAESG
jgi:thiol-disulfide isomerase/thioredoxin